MEVNPKLDGLDQAQRQDARSQSDHYVAADRPSRFRGEWQSKRLGDVVDANPENLGPNSSSDFAFKYIALEDVELGFLRSHSEQVFAKAPSRARRKLRPSDILVSTVRPNLKSHLLFSGHDGNWVCSTGFCVVRCRELIAHPSFVFSQLFTDGVTRQIDALITGSNYPAISSSDVRSLMMPFPDFEEQSAIAAVLSDVDALLDGLDRLIAKKRDLKQATMQQLLAGQTRLPGFSAEWVARPLCEIGDIKSGGTPSTRQMHFWDGGLPWCTPTDITALRDRKYLTDTARTISKAGLQSSSAEVIPPQSLIMTSRATIGECAINLVPVTTNQGFKNILTFAETDVEFLYYFMTTQKASLVALCAGSTFLEIGKKQLGGFMITLPEDRREQEAIATVLSDMDAEIAELEVRRDKTRNLKQAMMQELLTGRTRLVQPEVAHA